MAVDGTYKIEIETPIGKQEATMALKTAGEKLSGTAESPLGKGDFTGTVKGNDLSWSLEVNSPMGKIKLDFTGKLSGNDISGQVKLGGFGNSSFKGKKV